MGNPKETSEELGRLVRNMVKYMRGDSTSHTLCNITQYIELIAKLGYNLLIESAQPTKMVYYVAIKTTYKWSLRLGESGRLAD